MADARHLPQAGLERGDRHLKFYETRDNLADVSATRYGVAMGSSELPGAIDEQFCGAGCPAKRSLIQSTACGSHTKMAEM